MKVFALWRRAASIRAFRNAAALAAAVSAISPAAAAELRVFSGGAPQQVVRQIAVLFEALSGCRVEDRPVLQTGRT